MKMRYVLKTTLWFLFGILPTVMLGILPSSALAFSGLTYHGRIIKPDGTALDSSTSTVDFKIQIRSPGTNNCLMYEETQNSVTVTNGVFALIFGSDSSVGTFYGGTTSIKSVLDNSSSFTFGAPSGCTVTTTYNPNSGDGRNLAVFFRENAGAWEPMPVASVTAVPYAVNAMQADKVGAHNTSSLLRVENTGVPASAAAFTSAQFTELQNLIAGTSTQYTPETINAGTEVKVISGAASAPVTGSLWLDSSSGTLKFYDGSSIKTIGAGASATGTVTAITAGTGLSGGTITTSGTISIAPGGVSSTELANNSVTSSKIVDGTIVSADLSPSISISTTGSITASGAITSASNIIGAGLSTGGSLSVAGNSTILGNEAVTGNVGANSVSTRTIYLSNNVGSTLSLAVPTAAFTNFGLILPSQDGTNGQTLLTNGSGQLYWGSTGTGLSASTAFVNGGNSFGAGASLGTNDNYSLSLRTNNIDRLTVDTSGNVGIGIAPTVKLDVNGSIRSQGTTSGLSTSAITSGASATGVSIQNGIGIAGTLTNGYGLSITESAVKGTITTAYGIDINPPTATIGGSIGTYYGLYVDTPTVATTNYAVYSNGGTNYFGGNVGIGTSSPSASLDITKSVKVGTTLSFAGSTSGTVGFQAPAVAGNKLWTLPSTDGTSGQFLSTNGSGILSWATASGGGLSASTAFVNGGNAFGGTAMLGTTDNNKLQFITNNTAQVTIDTNGRLGVGTSAPSDSLDVTGALRFSSSAGHTVGNARVYYNSTDGLTLAGKGGTTNEFSYLSSIGDRLITVPAGTTKVNFQQATTVGFPLASVGIGTSSPTTNLDVVGSEKIGGSLSFAGSTSGTVAFKAPAVSGNTLWTLPSTDGTSSQVLQTNGSGVLSWATIASGLSASTAFVNGGNAFGVGASLGTKDSNSLSLITNNSNVMTLSSAGKVMIGTTTPAATFTVAGSGSVGLINNVTGSYSFGAGAVNQVTGNYAAALGSNGTASGDNSVALNQYGTSIGTASLTAGYNAKANGNYSFAAGNNTTADAYAELVIGQYNLLPTANATSWVATDPIFVIGNGSATNVRSNALTILKNGNIGVGTSTPQASIDVTSSVKIGDTLSFAGSTSGAVGFRAPATAGNTLWTLPSTDGTSSQVLQTNGSGTLSWATISSGLSASTAFVNGGNAFGGIATLGTNDNNSLQFKTNGTTQMTVNTSGYVGVGTTGPTDNLTISGASYPGIGISGPSGNSYDYIYMHEPGANRYVQLQYNSSGTAGGTLLDIPSSGVLYTGSGTSGLSIVAINNPIRFGTNNFNENMRIDTNGYVGIGTTVPQASLDVSGSVKVGTTLTLSGATSGTVGFKAPNVSGNKVWTLPSTDGTNGQVLATNGSATLSWTTISTGLSGSTTLFGDGTSGAPSISFANDTDTGIYRPGTNTLGFSTGGSERVRIDSSGNIGIGTTNPSFQFQIGDLTTSKVQPFVVMGAYQGFSTTNGTALFASTDTAAIDKGGSITLGGQDGSGALRTFGAIGGFKENGTSSNYAGYLSFATRANGSNPTERMHIDSSGNVGIGTSAPAASLDVSGAISVKTSYDGATTYTNTGAAYSIPDTSVSVVQLTATANTTITLPTFTAPSSRVYTLTVFIKQDATGGRTVTFAGAGSDTIKWDSGVTPPISTTANKITILQFIKPSFETVWYGSMSWRED